jgi:hypothetical protein
MLEKIKRTDVVGGSDAWLPPSGALSFHPPDIILPFAYYDRLSATAAFTAAAARLDTLHCPPGWMSARPSKHPGRSRWPTRRGPTSLPGGDRRRS